MNPIVVGDKQCFAIESGTSQAFARLSLHALGYFTIYVKGRQYGIQAPDATMLACSFDEVQRRLARRGSHIALSLNYQKAEEIAIAVHHAIYGENEGKEVLGFSQEELRKIVYQSKLLWAPDGDEAFDDSSRILHFDVGDKVRLIAYKASAPEEEYPYERESLKEEWLSADEFYRILHRWSSDFEAEWIAAPKISET